MRWSCDLPPRDLITGRPWLSLVNFRPRETTLHANESLTDILPELRTSILCRRCPLSRPALRLRELFRSHCCGQAVCQSRDYFVHRGELDVDRFLPGLSKDE